MQNKGLELEPDGGASSVAASAKADAERRDLALVALERTRMPMAISDPRQPDNPIVLANAAFLDLTGYTTEEVVGRNCRFLQGPETDQAVVQSLREAIAQAREIEVELLNYRKDGSSFWNQILVSPVHNEAGDLVYFFASQKDETVRRRAAELELVERRLLMEVDHRAKNALALVQSIVRLTQRDDSEAYATSIEGRVDAIARAHRLLADSNWADIPISALFEVGSAGAGPGRVELSGPPTFISAAKVQPFSLLIHEMVDNAVKHGALSQVAGKLSIHWTTDDLGRELTIEIEESGGPRPGDNPRSGLGQQLINRIITHQLNGSAVFSYHGGGLRSVLTMAAVNS